MKQHVREHLEKYIESMGYQPTNEMLIDVLTTSVPIYEERLRKHRWWVDYLYVVDIDGMFIGFENAMTTGDTISDDLGYEFDIDSVWEMHPVTKTIVVYERNGGE